MDWRRETIAESSHKTILIVDDEDDIREIVSDVVSKWGYQPIVARNGREALERFERNKIDVVLTDLKMPEMDGITLLEEIKARDKKAVVIVLTGHPTIDSAIKAIKEGAFDYLTKPVDLEELRVKIDRSLERRRLLRTLSFMRGLNWALIIMIPIWLLLGIILASILK